MPKMTPGNRLYLYKLLSQELGVGKQTALARVGEVLEADGVWPEDLGLPDVRSLCEALPECVKMTVFKKGYVYATVIANDEYDRALELASSDADKGAASGKPWKRKKGAKGMKPVKPRHVEREAEQTGPSSAAEETAEPKVTPENEPKSVQEAVHEAEQEAVHEAEPKSEPEPEPGAEIEPEPASEPEAEPEPEPEPKPEPTSELKPAPAPASTPKPSISFTITYVPEAEPEPEPEPAPLPEPAVDAGPSPHDKTPKPSHRVTTRAQADLPQDFYAEVRCPNEQLSTLYQLLPPNVDPMATLEEDFRVARSTGSLDGTRSTVTFALSYLRSDGSSPVTVTLRRSARRMGGKRWTLVEVDGGDAAESFEGLEAAQASGPWAAFTPEGEPVPDLERELAKTVAVGSWNETLERLASLAASEDWGEGRHVLHDLLVMSCTRARAEGLFSKTEDGRHALLDTGLVTEKNEPVFAVLVAQRDGSDIPWHLEGFVTTGDAPALRYATSFAEVTLDPSLAVPECVPVETLARNPRLATTAYDPVGNRAVLIVPSRDGASALALSPREGAYELVTTLSLADAYACARVVSSEQPSWLR